MERYEAGKKGIKMGKTKKERERRGERETKGQTEEKKEVLKKGGRKRERRKRFLKSKVPTSIRVCVCITFCVKKKKKYERHKKDTKETMRLVG